MTYAGEGPIGFAGQSLGGNYYNVLNSWGSTSGQPGGTWLIGARHNQSVITLNVSSTDCYQTLFGEMP